MDSIRSALIALRDGHARLPDPIVALMAVAGVLAAAFTLHHRHLA
jgi:hypothetical protein